MNETNTSQPNKPTVPRKRIWIMGILFFIVGIGMYAGTMYRIQNHGYVGIGDDQPITKPEAQSATQPTNADSSN